MCVCVDTFTHVCLVKLINNKYHHIISMNNLMDAWREFVVGKRSRKDVQLFERNLITNILKLHQDLVDETYRHSKYYPFKISDPKPRDIHKASVRDRLLHKAIYRVLYPIWDKIQSAHRPTLQGSRCLDPSP